MQIGYKLLAEAYGPQEHVVANAQPYVDAGLDRLVLMNAGPDPDEFLMAYPSELRDRLRGLKTSRRD